MILKSVPVIEHTVQYLLFWRKHSNSCVLFSKHVKTLAAIERVVCKLWFSDPSLFLNTTTSLLVSQSKFVNPSDKFKYLQSFSIEKIGRTNLDQLTSRDLVVFRCQFRKNRAGLTQASSKPRKFVMLRLLLLFSVESRHFCCLAAMETHRLAEI